MKTSKLEKTFLTVLSEPLRKHGFSSEGSQHSVFWRVHGEGIYNFIFPAMKRNSDRFEVFVFPTHPEFNPLFRSSFPDRIGCAVWRGYLSEVEGLTSSAQWFNCVDDAILDNNLKNKILPALINLAIPQLDEVRTLRDLAPLLHTPLSKALAQWRLGDRDAARSVLERWLGNFTRDADSSEDAREGMEFLKVVLQE